MGSPDLCLRPPSGPGLKKAAKMDAIRKKMQSMKFDIDALYQKNAEYEEDIRQSNAISDQFDIQIRDTGKKVQKFETNFEEILEKMTSSAAKMDEAEKEFKDKDDDVNAAARRCVLMEGEATVSVEKLATTVMKLALMSKEADNIIKGARHWESKNMNNEMEIETLARSLAMMEDELKRAEERVKIAEERVVKIEEELSAIGENQKQLEISEEKARRREEKYQDQIKQINIKLKESDSRSEYAEMNITKLHLRIDELEGEIIREKLKINAVSGQLDDTFNEMLNKY